MQLSAPTSPADPSLAALFGAAGRAVSAGAAVVTGGVAAGEGSMTGFAAMLSGATSPTLTASSVPTAPDEAGGAVAPAMCDAAQPAIINPAASVTSASFPSWIFAAGAESPPRPTAMPSVRPANAPEVAESLANEVVEISSGPLNAVNENGAEPTTSTPISPGRGARPAKPVAPRATPTVDAHSAVTVTVPPSPIVASGVADPVVEVPAAPQSPAVDSGETSPALSLSTGKHVESRPGFTQTLPLPSNETPLPSSGISTGEKFGQIAARSATRKGEKILPSESADSATSGPGATLNVSSPASFVAMGSNTPEIPNEPLPEIASAVAANTESPTRSAMEARLPTLSPRRVSSAAMPATNATPASVANVAGLAEVGREPAAAAVVSEVNPAAVSAFAPEMAAPSAVALPGAGENSAPDFSRDADFEDTIPTQAEIFAAVDGNFSGENKFTPNAAEKTFLSAAAKRVATRGPGLGTDVAKSEFTMSSATFSNRPSFVAPVERAPDAPVAGPVDPVASMLTSEPAHVAHRAVEAVMTAVDRFSSGDRHSVQMKFSVGGADLSVRVELRGEEVRTTFRTDSPELRSALAHEWQAATPSSADRPVKIAPPVFSANDSANFSAFSGDTASRQRDARARRSEAEDVFSSVASRPRPAAAVASSAVPIASARIAASPAALHLSTLA